MKLVEGAGALADRVTTLALEYAHVARDHGEPMGQERLGFIRASQFAAVLALAPTMMRANIANSGALVLLEYRNQTLTGATICWALIVWIFAINGLLAARRFHKAPRRPYASPRAPGRILLSSVLLALIWCYPVIVILASGSPLEIAFVSALTAGMVAGGSIALYPVPLAALTFVIVLVAACLPAIAISALPQKAPFLIVIFAFLCLVLQAILRHTGLFLAELRGRLDAEHGQDVVDLLVRAHASAGGHALWRADNNLSVIGDQTAIAAVLKLPTPVASSGLPVLLAAADCTAYREDDASVVESLLSNDAEPPDVFDVLLAASGGDVLRLVGCRAAREGAAPFGFHGWIKDVTTETRAQERAHWLATRDKATGLFNHEAFLEAARSTCAAAAEIEGGAALVLFVDADNLKGVNDSYGHAVGDLLIQQIARKLGESVPPNGLIARKSGDEFLALVVAESETACRATAEKVAAALNAFVGANGADLPLSCSVGATIAACDDADPDRMVLEADRALYRAKAAGGCRLSYYDRCAGEQLRQYRLLAHGIATAISEEQLSLAFQPIWRLSTEEQEPIGVEALVRWRHPQFGPIPATTIASLAADAACSDALTEFVLRQAITAAVNWPSVRILSVNLSAGSLHRHDFADTVLRLLQDIGFRPQRLWLEMTESEQHRDTPAMQRNVAALRRAGVSIAVDDFGAGYSTFAMLDMTPIDAIKIDRSLVRGCADRKSSAIVFGTLVQLAAANGCSIVAEGVETLEEADAIHAAGIHLAQGNFMSPPLDTADVTELLNGAPLWREAV